MKRAWRWWVVRIPALARYLDGLMDRLEEFRPQGRVPHQWSLNTEFATLYLTDCWVRVELTAETMCWPLCGIHLPCWDAIIRQATCPELGG